MGGGGGASAHKTTRQKDKNAGMSLASVEAVVATVTELTLALNRADRHLLTGGWEETECVRVYMHPVHCFLLCHLRLHVQVSTHLLSGDAGLLLTV